MECLNRNVTVLMHMKWECLHHIFTLLWPKIQLYHEQSVGYYVIKYHMTSFFSILCMNSFILSLSGVEEPRITYVQIEPKF